MIAITSSGTYAYAPSSSDLVLQAFSRIQIRGPELTAQHLADAATECNLLAVQFTNRNPNSWMLETPAIPLVQGVATYSLPSRTVAIGIAYITVGTGPGSFDSPMGPISATDWGAISVKSTQGQPTTLFLSMLPTPTITVWPVPDNGVYTVNVQSFRQMQDVGIGNGETLDAPYRFLDSFVAGLAARLARIYAPALYQIRQQDFESAFQEAAAQDQQSVNLYIVPQLSSYLR